MAFLIGAAIRAGKQAYSAHQDVANPSRPDPYTDKWGNPRDPGMVYEWVRKTESARRLKKEAKRANAGPGPQGSMSMGGPRERGPVSSGRETSGQMDKDAEAALDHKGRYHPSEADTPPPYSPSAPNGPQPRTDRDRKPSSSSSDLDSDSEPDEDDDISREEYEHYRSLQQKGELPAAVAVPAQGVACSTPSGPAPAPAGSSSAGQGGFFQRGLGQPQDGLAVPIRDPRLAGQRTIRYPEGMWMDRGLRREFRKENKDAYRVLKKQRRMEKRMARFERRALRRLP